MGTEKKDEAAMTIRISMRRIAYLYQEFQEQIGLSMEVSDVQDIFRHSNFRILESAVEKYCAIKEAATETCKSGLKLGLQYLMLTVSTILRQTIFSTEKKRMFARLKISSQNMYPVIPLLKLCGSMYFPL